MLIIFNWNANNYYSAMLSYKYFDSMTTTKILINPKYIGQQINEKSGRLVFCHRVERELESVWSHVISSCSKHLWKRNPLSPPCHSITNVLRNCVISESNCFSLFLSFMYRAQYLFSPFFTQFKKFFMRAKLEGICSFCWLSWSSHDFLRSCRIHRII